MIVKLIEAKNNERTIIAPYFSPKYLKAYFKHLITSILLLLIMLVNWEIDSPKISLAILLLKISLNLHSQIAAFIVKLTPIFLHPESHSVTLG